MQMRPSIRSSGESQANFWPGLIDMLTTVLMVFLMISFIQTALNIREVSILVNQQRLKQRFEKEFQQEIADGTLAVKPGLNLLQITFSDHILFGKKGYQIRPEGRLMLGRCATLFRDSREYKQIQIEGHTDADPVSGGSYPSNNWELSTARAISVLRYLTEAGLPPRLFTANGYAQYKPVASNDTEEDKKKNRRIEILVLFSTPDDPTPLSISTTAP